jgi:organic radical activating enzyme
VEANLVEVFSSIQGEGPDVGTRTLFVRFGACDLRCAWCDSPHTWRPAEHCRLERAPGSGEFDAVPNPLQLGDLLDAARRLDVASHRFVSLTGGEPLLQPAAAAACAEALRALGPQLLLETHGLHAGALVAVLPHLDVLSMDWKLASDVRREGQARGAARESFHPAHEAFLRAAGPAPRVVVKIVVTPASGDEEVAEACERIARVRPDACLVLQPVTPTGTVREAPTAGRLHALERLAARSLADVRVIPQTHPQWGAL